MPTIVSWHSGHAIVLPVLFSKSGHCRVGRLCFHQQRRAGKCCIDCRDVAEESGLAARSSIRLSWPHERVGISRARRRPARPAGPASIAGGAPQRPVTGEQPPWRWQKLAPVYDPEAASVRLECVCVNYTRQPSRHGDALMAHLKAKQAGMPPQPKQSWTVPRRAINLTEGLRRSIAGDKKPRRAGRHRPASEHDLVALPLMKPGTAAQAEQPAGGGLKDEHRAHKAPARLDAPEDALASLLCHPSSSA
jgi:hypothetical protein